MSPCPSNSTVLGERFEAQPLDPFEIERLAAREDDAHRHVAGQVGGLVRHAQERRQHVPQRVHAAADQRRNFAQAVAHRQPRVAIRDGKQVLEQLDLGQLDGHNQAQVFGERIERALAFGTHALDEIDGYVKQVAGDFTRLAEMAFDHRAELGVREQFGRAAQIRLVIATEGERRLLQPVADFERLERMWGRGHGGRRSDEDGITL
ncbi:MAG TPA: hypothetical protein PK867_16850 [Pirellulales bacterium]|nr:hypothetical protein [Pirellulales bacterium]